MRTIHSQDDVLVPTGVTADVNSRVVTVTGRRGTLTRSFKHFQCDIKIISGKRKKIQVEVWFGSTKERATIRTVCSHIKNMITGVMKGFEYKMKFVYAHFPINVAIAEDGKKIEIRNFLGEKIVRKVDMLEGVTVARTDQKDEIALKGNDIDLVSQSAASIHNSCLVKNKDIRKFLDGIYVSERNVLPTEK